MAHRVDEECLHQQRENILNLVKLLKEDQRGRVSPSAGESRSDHLRLCVLKLERDLSTYETRPLADDVLISKLRSFIEDVRQSLQSTSPGNASGKKALYAVGCVVGAVAGGTVAVAAAPAVLGAVGFTATGVAAGSIAASVQSVVYGAFTCGVFSALQSAGAAGVGLATAAGGAVVGALTGGTAVAVAEKVQNDGKKKEHTS